MQSLIINYRSIVDDVLLYKKKTQTRGQTMKWRDKKKMCVLSDE